ncbi:MAG: DUF447 family protein [Crenarchaeota archaeon]|nr:DUF447 family protein [Thermoproteota archaeon]
MSSDLIHEFILSTWLDGYAYAAPVGIRVARSGALKARIYRGGRLWKACATCSAFVLNACLDPRPFILSILDRSRLEFENSEMLALPALRDCEGYVECIKIGSVDRGHYLDLYLQPIHGVARRLKPYTRALGLGIELLIELTRIWVGVRSCDEIKGFLEDAIDRMGRVWVSEYVEVLRRELERACKPS